MADTSVEVLRASPLLAALVFPLTPHAFIILDEYVEGQLSRVAVTKCNKFKQFSRRENKHLRPVEAKGINYSPVSERKTQKHKNLHVKIFPFQNPMLSNTSAM